MSSNDSDDTLPRGERASAQGRLRAEPTPARPQRVVIVGGGFAGLTCAKELIDSGLDVTLVDRSNHHLFQPLLYQVATGVLVPTDIAYPLRRVFRHHDDVNVVIGEVESIDVDRREVLCDGRALPYDRLVLAAGATDHWFGHDEWAEHATGLKTLSQAIEIRNRTIRAFEEAAFTSDPDERRRWITFVIVGGGPTGVELAGAIKQLAVDQVDDDFPEVDLNECSVILVQGGARLLPSFDESSSAEAKDALERIGVDVRLCTRVTRIDEDGVIAGDERIEARNVIWAAGVRGSALGAQLGVETVARGCVPVEPDLRVAGRPEIFVVGDLASVHDEASGQDVPGVAQGAIQMGNHVARALKAEVDGRAHDARRTFRYRDKGSMATIGRGRAVVEMGSTRLRGFVAWALWGVVHVMFLVGFRNKLTALLGWTWAYLFFTGGTEIISRPFRRKRAAAAASVEPVAESIDELV